MKKIIKFLHHYAHAIECRSYLLLEYYYQKKNNKKYPDLFCKILRHPEQYEDGINLSRFLAIDEKILLVDAGANTGYWAENFISFFPNTSIIAFEPDPRAYKKIKDRFTHKQDCIIHNVALSNEEGIAKFNMANISTFSSFEAFDSSQDERDIHAINTIEVQKTKLDNYDIASGSFDKRVLKIDVQGHEIELLKGTTNNLKYFDVVIVELSFANEYKNIKPSFIAAAELMHTAGLYPLIFQDYGRQLSPYAWERDVIFVKEHLIDKIWGF